MIVNDHQNDADARQESGDPGIGTAEPLSKMNPNEPEPIEFEINGELDLHTFRPAEVGELIPDYISLCLEKGIRRVRIIHGKGTGTLRTTVQAILKRDPHVARFELAGADEGSWGATIVWLQD